MRLRIVAYNCGKLAIKCDEASDALMMIVINGKKEVFDELKQKVRRLYDENKEPIWGIAIADRTPPFALCGGVVCILQNKIVVLHLLEGKYVQAIAFHHTDYQDNTGFSVCKRHHYIVDKWRKEDENTMFERRDISIY